MINVILDCETCQEKRDILIVQSATMPTKFDLYCSCCGNRWVEFWQPKTLLVVMMNAIEEATFGLSVGEVWDLEGAAKIISEIRRLNQIENRAEQYLQAVKSPKVMNAYDHWTRKIVEYVLNGRVIPSGGVIEY